MSSDRLLHYPGQIVYAGTLLDVQAVCQHLLTHVQALGPKKKLVLGFDMEWQYMPSERPPALIQLCARTSEAVPPLLLATSHEAHVILQPARASDTQTNPATELTALQAQCTTEQTLSNDQPEGTGAERKRKRKLQGEAAGRKQPCAAASRSASDANQLAGTAQASASILVTQPASELLTDTHTQGAAGSHADTHTQDAAGHSTSPSLGTVNQQDACTGTVAEPDRAGCEFVCYLLHVARLGASGVERAPAALKQLLEHPQVFLVTAGDRDEEKLTQEMDIHPAHLEQVNMMHFLLRSELQASPPAPASQPSAAAPISVPDPQTGSAASRVGAAAKPTRKQRRQQQRQGPGAVVAPREVISLSSLVGLYLGKKMDKTCQLANEAWESPVLEARVLQYAATDAYAQLLVFEEIKARLRNHMLQQAAK